MDNQLLERINALAKKNKTEGLTQQEIEERDSLRKEYLRQFREGMTNMLEHTSIQHPDGTIQKLKKR